MTQYYAAASMPTRRTQAGWRRNQNTVAYRVKSGLGPVTNAVIVILLLSVLGLIYLTQITKTSTYGYEMNALETKRQELANEKTDLQVESARLEALENVKKSSVAANMNAPVQTDYRN